MGRLCYKPEECCWFDLVLSLVWEQFQADKEEFFVSYPLTSSSERLKSDIEWIEKILFPELAVMPCPERLLEGCLVGNIESALLYIENERGLMLGMLSYELLCGSIEGALL